MICSQHPADFGFKASALCLSMVLASFLLATAWPAQANDRRESFRLVPAGKASFASNNPELSCSTSFEDDGSPDLAASTDLSLRGKTGSFAKVFRLGTNDFSKISPDDPYKPIADITLEDLRNASDMIGYIPVEDLHDLVKRPIPTDQASLEKMALASQHRFKNFWDGVADQLLERDYAIDALKLACVGGLNFLAEGPAGSGKTALLKLVGENLLEAQVLPDGSLLLTSSFYTRTADPESSKAIAEGATYFPAMSALGVARPTFSEGGVLSRLLFIDEFTRLPFRALQSLLDLTGERAISIGRFAQKALNRLAMFASNKSNHDIAAEYSHPTDWRPMYDRIGVTIYTLAGFNFYESIAKLDKRRNQGAPNQLPVLMYRDLEILEALADKVIIPESVTAALAILRTKMNSDTADSENRARQDWLDLDKKGPHTPGYARRTREYSQRTDHLARKMLQLTVLLDWLSKSGKDRDLIAHVKDLERISLAYIKGGPETEFITESLQQADPFRQRDLQALLDERLLFEKALKKLSDDVAVAVTQHKNPAIATFLQEPQIQNRSKWTRTPAETRKRTLEFLREEYQRLDKLWIKTGLLRVEHVTPEMAAIEQLKEEIVTALSKVMDTKKALEALKNAKP